MHVDLVLVGTGSGNSVVTAAMKDWSIAIFERDRFGGTCLNVGCIPSKMFEYPAEIADAVTGGARYGIEATLDKVRWPAIRDRIFGRIDSIEDSGREYRRGDRTPNITLFETTARFVGPKTIEAGTGERITADRVVIASGGRPVIPDIEGLAEVGYHTSDTIMRLDEQPGRIAIVGGGYIAAEFAHIFSSLGTAVTQIVRGEALLTTQDHEVSERFTEIAGQRWDLRLHSRVRRFERHDDGIRLHLDGADGAVVDVDTVLIAIGRIPNTDLLDPAASGVEMHSDGRVKVDDYQRTSVDGIFALGDVSSDYQLKHVANAEARTVAHNLLHPEDLWATDHRFVPAAVFTAPQIASVGLTEQQARERGIPYRVGRRDYGGTAAGWAREDTTGFVKLLADPESGRLIGAHVIGPEAATVIQPAIQAMSFGQTARGLARGQYWIHPALPEVLENALLALEED